MKYPHIDRSISEIRYKTISAFKNLFFERDFNMFEKIDRVLICKLKFYGDVLLTTPVIASIRARYPHAKIDLLLYKDTKAILAAHKDINTFYLIEKTGPAGNSKELSLSTSTTEEKSL